MKMYESSEWPSTGILSSTTFYLGNWDGCLMVSNYNVKGQYCKVQGIYNYTNAVRTDITAEPVEWPNEELPAWNVLKMFEKNPIRANRTILNWAMCIPASCSSNDLKLSMQNTLFPLFENQNLSISVDIKPEFCHVKKRTEFSLGYFVTNIVIISLVVLIFWSTTNELMEPKDNEDSKEIVKSSLSKEIFDSFSAIKNVKQLYQPSSKSEFGIVHFLKLIGIIVIIYGHRRVYSLGYPNFNFEKTEINFKNHVYYFELMHLTCVDIFFMITGFLTFHFDFSSFQKYGSVYCFISAVHRWIRLIPVFGIFILFFIYVFPYVSDGPIWDSFVTDEINRCKISWWANILAISNIVEVDNQCLIISWYISTDMQLTLIGLVLMYVISKNRKLGICLTVLSLFLGMAITFVMTYVNRYHGLLPIVISFLQNPSKSEEFTRSYIRTYSRIAPYLIGFISALTVKTLKEKNFTFTTRQKIFGTLLTFVIGEMYQYLGVDQYDFDYKYEPLKSSFYAATHRAIFVLPEAFVLCIYFTSGLGFVDAVLDNVFLPVAGRLTYSAFLVNTVLQIFHAASQQTPLSGSLLINRFWWVASDSVYSYLLGFIVFVALEAPLANISKSVRTRLIRHLSPVPNVKENQKKKTVPEFNYSQEKQSVKNGNCNNAFHSESLEGINYDTKM
ncbi:hypothetical protein PGB90_004773 [Kerria lacca]